MHNQDLKKYTTYKKSTTLSMHLKYAKNPKVRSGCFQIKSRKRETCSTANLTRKLR